MAPAVGHGFQKLTYPFARIFWVSKLSKLEDVSQSISVDSELNGSSPKPEQPKSRKISTKRLFSSRDLKTDSSGSIELVDPRSPDPAGISRPWPIPKTWHLATATGSANPETGDGVTQRSRFLREGDRMELRCQTGEHDRQGSNRAGLPAIV